MGKLYVTKYVNSYIRNNLNKCVRNDIHKNNILNKKIEQILKDASDRADMEGKKTIMAKHL